MMESTYLLSYKAAGKVLGVTDRTIFEFVRRGDLPSVDLGYRNKRIDPADLKTFIERRKTTATNHTGAAGVPLADNRNI